MARTLFYIAFSLLFNTVYAQRPSKFKEPAFITSFPFKQLSGGVMMIQGRFNNIPDTLNFLLDTGSGSISLDSTTCEEFKIKHSPSGKTINGIAGVKEVDYTQNNTLALPGLKVNNLDFYINDYDILSSVYGEKVDGIIGYSFFSRYIVKFNFDSLVVEIFEPGEITYPPGGYLLHPLFTALPIEPLRVKDERTVTDNFYLDTGAGLCFLLSKSFVDESAFLMKKRKPVPIQAEGLGGRKRMMITVIKEVKLGPYIFRRVPTHILDDEFNATSYPYLGGLLGNDILRRFNVILNYQRKEIHLLPNSHFKDVFDYSYTGMSIYYEDGKILIDDIIIGSPAQKAGFKKDDVIISVNNNFSNNITQYKNLLQTAGDKIKIVLLRDNAPIIITFKVEKIF
ncbi:MAG: aspartyl protease family protein [Chitinophagaceae bacterium]|nr:aspartyl protease family protein [Chitinophagaceae bacterium]